MDTATRERIFEPFITTRRTGTGIGLSVVHGILAAHQGHPVVDDEPMLVSIALRLLTREGSRAVGFADSTQALEAIRAYGSDIELVVTDFNMPQLSGLELALAVRAAHPEIPIVLSSGYLTQELEQEALRAGVELVISKTELVTSLVSIVGRLVRA